MSFRIPFFTFFICFFGGSISAQFDLAWLHTFEPHGHSKRTFQADTNGNYYSIFNYTPRNNDQIGNLTFKFKWLSKVSTLVKSTGGTAVVWHRTTRAIGQTYNHFTFANVHYTDVAVSPDGKNIVVMGFSEGRIAFPGSKDTITVGCQRDAYISERCETYFLMCYSPDGDIRWRKEIDNAQYDFYDKIKIGPSGDIYLIKFYDKTLSMNGKPIARVESEGRRVSILRFGSNGKFKENIRTWIDNIPNNYDSAATHKVDFMDLAFDKLNRMVIYGKYDGNMVLSDSVSLGHPDRYSGARAGFIVCYGNDSEPVWYLRLGGSSTGVRLCTPTFDEENNTYLAGSYSNSIDISKGNDIVYRSDKPAVSKAGHALFYAKVSDTGNIVFIRYHTQKKHWTNFGAASVFSDKYGYVHMLGYYNDSLDIMPDKILFPGEWTDTSSLTYDGIKKPLYHKKYSGGTFYAVWLEDSLVHIQDLARYTIRHTINHGFFEQGVTWQNSHVVFMAFRRPMEILSRTGPYEVETSAVSDQSFMCRLNLVKRPRIVKTVRTPILAELLEIPEEIEASETPEDADPVAADVTVAPDMLVYPNPFVTGISVKLTGMETASVVNVYSESGQLIFSKRNDPQIRSASFELDFTNLESGLYFLEVQDGDKRVVKRLVKQ